MFLFRLLIAWIDNHIFVGGGGGHRMADMFYLDTPIDYFYTYLYYHFLELILIPQHQTSINLSVSKGQGSSPNSSIQARSPPQ